MAGNAITSFSGFNLLFYNDHMRTEGFGRNPHENSWFPSGKNWGLAPRQADSPTTVRLSDFRLTVAGLSDYRNSAPSPRKADSPPQPINCTNACCESVMWFRCCAFALWFGSRFTGSTAVREIKVFRGHGAVFPPRVQPEFLCHRNTSRPWRRVLRNL
jgi:hypothetical protein